MSALAEQLPQIQNEQLDQYTRYRNDTVTWLAETLYGSMRTSFDYRHDGQELYATDNGAMSEVFDGAISEAKAIVKANPSLLFELRRRIIEKGEYLDMLRMAKGELPNTMIVVSDFPPELMQLEQDLGGYNANRKQTMLRIITRQKDGTLRMTSQSLDRSNRKALEKMLYDRLGFVPEEGELLGQRIFRELPDEWQPQLVDNLTDSYDQSLAEQYGGSWHAGIKQSQERQIRDTYDFVLAQVDLINWFTEAKTANPVAAESLRYKLASTISERFKRQTVIRLISPNITPIVHQPQFYSELMLEIEQSTSKAISRGETFSGCGMTSSMRIDQDNTIEGQLRDSGYGSKASEDKYGSLHFKCQKGHNNTRPRGKLLEKCQKCGISVRC